MNNAHALCSFFFLGACHTAKCLKDWFQCNSHKSNQSTTIMKNVPKPQDWHLCLKLTNTSYRKYPRRYALFPVRQDVCFFSSLPEHQNHSLWCELSSCTVQFQAGLEQYVDNGAKNISVMQKSKLQHFQIGIRNEDLDRGFKRGQDAYWNWLSALVQFEFARFMGTDHSRDFK